MTTYEPNEDRCRASVGSAGVFAEGAVSESPAPRTLQLTGEDVTTLAGAWIVLMAVVIWAAPRLGPPRWLARLRRPPFPGWFLPVLVYVGAGGGCYALSTVLRN